MPHSLSAAKRVRQDAKRRLANRSAKSAVKTQVKKFLAALEGGDVAAAVAQYRATVRILDKAVTRGVLHKGTAARHKSRLAAKLNKLKAAPAAPAQPAPSAEPTQS
jgi:small subunit ribosomal protein S20